MSTATARATHNGNAPPGERPPDGWGLGAPGEAEAPGAPNPPEDITGAGTDPAAPFGYTVDGRPKTSRRGRPRAPGTTRTRTSTSGAGGRTGPRTGSGKAKPAGNARTRPRVDYKTPLDGIAQLLGVPLFFASPLDAAALIVHQDAITTALDDIANNDPRMAAVLDRILVAGPYGALLAPLCAFGAQVAVNHNVIPPEVGKYLGAVPPEVLLTMVNIRAGGPPPADPPPAPPAGP